MIYADQVLAEWCTSIAYAGPALIHTGPAIHVDRGIGGVICDLSINLNIVWRGIPQMKGNPPPGKGNPQMEGNPRVVLLV